MSEFTRKMNLEAYHNRTLSNDSRWLLLDKLYEKNYLDGNKSQERIPKKIHQVWLGSNLPDKYYYYIQTLKDTNPDWEYKLWTDIDVESFNLKNKKLYNSTFNNGSRSDIFRLEILERFGGVYIDIDFMGVKSLNDTIHLDFFAGTGQYPEPIIYNGLMGTIPNGKIVSNMVFELMKIQPFSNTIDGIMNVTGPYFLEKEFYKNTTLDDNFVIFPTPFFYPFPGDMRHIPQEGEYVNIVNSFNTSDTICTHMWHTNWQK